VEAVIAVIGVLFTVAVSGSVVAGNVREPRPAWTWAEPPSATYLPPLDGRVCESWSALRAEGYPLGPCAPGIRADVTFTELEEAVYPDNLGRTVTTVARDERVAVSARVELATLDALDHEVTAHVLGLGHAGRRGK
jgi:hypothetical protein